MTLYRCTQPGGLPSGETFDFTYFMNASSLVEAQSAVDAWSTYLSTSTVWTGLFTSTTTFSECVVAEISETTGLQVTAGPAGTAYAGSGGSAALPPQIAIVVTLLTGIQSRTTRGRFYLPAPHAASTTLTGRLDISDQGDVVDEMAAAFGELISAGANPCVYSRKDRSTQNVTSISVGDVLDTQRRRRDKLFEARVTSPVGG